MERSSHDVIAVYESSLAKRGFVSDPAQWRAVERLQRLYEEWTAYKAKRSNALKRFLVRPDLPKGVYLWGPVGRGKSFLMDAFYLCVPLERKRRVHFHHFMREIHRELDEVRGTEDPIAEVAERTARRRPGVVRLRSAVRRSALVCRLRRPRAALPHSDAVERAAPVGQRLGCGAALHLAGRCVLR